MTRDFKALRRAVAPLARHSALGLGVVEINLTGDADAHQTAQVEGLDDERHDEVPHLQPYGMSARPKAGAVGVMLALGGQRGEGVILIVGDHRYRLTGLEEGEVAIHDDQGQVIHLKRSGIDLYTPFDFAAHAGGDMAFSADGNMTFAAQGDLSLSADGAGTVQAGGALTLESDDVHLGGSGGAQVARKGDAVAGGVITGGSTKVKAL
ncbi:MAG: bacteriophage Mu Gp45 protein [Caulobacter sp.]|nr:bacteriophage Mu Gp45 protein [Caulobacter sp.]